MEEINRKINFLLKIITLIGVLAFGISISGLIAFININDYVFPIESNDLLTVLGLVLTVLNALFIIFIIAAPVYVKTHFKTDYLRVVLFIF